MATQSQKIPLSSSIDMVEALAARKTILFTTELGFNRVVFGKDSINIYNAFRKETYQLS